MAQAPSNQSTLNITVNSTQAQGAVGGLTNALGRMAQQASATGTATDNLFNRVNNGFRSVESNVLNLRNVILGFGTAIVVFKQISDAISRFQAFISTMTVTTGTVQASRREFEFLFNMGNRLGVAVNDLTRNYAQLSAAAAGSNISHQALQKTFESFAIAARALHLSGAETNLMFYAITQMVSKGTVSMEELRRQLGEKLPGAMQIAARSVNTTVSELEEAIRKGAVSSTKFLPIFAEAVRQTFGPALVEATTALDAEFNRLRNSLTAIIVKFYDLGVASSFTKIIQELNRVLGDTKMAEAFADVLKKIADGVTSFLKGITPEDIRRWVEGFTKAMGELANFITNNVMPAIRMLADNFRIIIEGYTVLKLTSIGSAIGGPVGAAVGAGTGLGAVAVGRGWYPGGRDIMAPAGAPRGSTDYEKLGLAGVLGKANTPGAAPSVGAQDQKLTGWELILSRLGFTMTPDLRGRIIMTNEKEMQELMKGLDWSNKKMIDKVQHDFVKLLFGGGKSSTTLRDVLQNPDKKGGATADPLRSFLDSLQIRLESTGAEGNIYAGYREKLDDLIRDASGKGGKGNLSLVPQIREAINQLEARGDEYRPLITRLEGLMDRGNQDSPATMERMFADLLIRFPGANQGMKDRADELLKRFRAQYEGQKLVREANYTNQRTSAQMGLDFGRYNVLLGLANEQDRYTTQLQGLTQTNDQRERSIKQLELERQLTSDINRLREEATQKGLVFDETAFRDQAERSINAVMAALRRLQDYQKSAQYGVQSAVITYSESLQNLAQGTNQIVTSVFQNLEDAIVQFTLTGEINIKKLAVTFIEQLTRMYVQQQIMKPLVGTYENPGIFSQFLSMGLSAFGNMFLGGMMGSGGLVGGGLRPGVGGVTGYTGGGGIGLRPSGSGLSFGGGGTSWLNGYASGGQFPGAGWVGEQGPELFVPGVPGYIVPNRAAMSMDSRPNVSISVTVVMGEGGGVSSKSEDDRGREAGDMLGSMIEAKILDMMRPGNILADIGVDRG